MSTTAVSAGQIMDRAANLLNDPNKTDYNYRVMIPYLNLAIEEFTDALAESNSPYANQTSTNFPGTPIVVPVGTWFLSPPNPDNIALGQLTYPPDLLEFQEIGERPLGDLGPFIRLPRREFEVRLPPTNSLLFWILEGGVIRFNPNGATVPMEVQIKAIYQGVAYVATPNDLITVVGSRTYLAYKTAAFCALFIGENESRAQVLEDQASKALERTLNISNKGKQEIPTRHRPFRASYKMRGGSW